MKCNATGSRAADSYQSVLAAQSTAAQRSTAGRSIFLRNNLAKYTKSFLVPPSRMFLHRAPAASLAQNERETTATAAYLYCLEIFEMQLCTAVISVRICAKVCANYFTGIWNATSCDELHEN